MVKVSPTFNSLDGLATTHVEFDASKPDGTMRKLISVDKLHSLGWTHKVEIEDGVKKLFDWYQESLKG